MGIVEDLRPAEPQPSRFAGTLLDILDSVEYARIKPEDVTDPVYRLRYEAYRRENFLPFNPDEIYTDPMDLSDNAYCFGVFIKGELASSLRIHHITPEQRVSPSMTVYDDILTPMLDQGVTFIDPTRFTADKEASLAYPALPFLTLRLVVLASEHFAADYGLASVRPEHAPFYKRVFRAEPLGPERSYQGLSFPIVMYATHCHPDIPKIVERFPFFMSTTEEREQLFAPGGRVKFGARVPTSARRAQVEKRRHAEVLTV